MFHALAIHIGMFTNIKSCIIVTTDKIKNSSSVDLRKKRDVIELYKAIVQNMACQEC